MKIQEWEHRGQIQECCKDRCIVRIFTYMKNRSPRVDRISKQSHGSQNIYAIYLITLKKTWPTWATPPSQMSIFLACRLQSWWIKERRCLWRGQWGTFCNEGMFNKFKLIRHIEIGLFYAELHSLKNSSRVEPLLSGWSKSSLCPRWALEMNPAVIQPHFYTELSAYWEITCRTHWMMANS